MSSGRVMRKGGLAPALGVFLVTALVVVGSGCSGKQGSAELDEGAEIDASAMSEDALAGKSSIDQFTATGEVAAGGVFRDVIFPYDSVSLDDAAREAIRHNAEWLREHSRARVEIEGHCDERGTSEYNLALGARRAKAVRDALIAQRIAADRLSTVSYGEELPLCKESTDACWGKNRRAHLIDLTR